MEYTDFRKSILKVNEKRNHKIKNSFGMRGAFSLAKQKGYLDKKVPEKDFYTIVRKVNELLAAELMQGNDVILQAKMGHLEVRKYETYVKLVGGKVRTNRGVDWKATLNLWYSDAEARENKTRVRAEDKKRFVLYYNKNQANYANKSLYLFKPNREMMIAINKAGNRGKIDAYNLKKW